MATLQLVLRIIVRMLGVGRELGFPGKFLDIPDLLRNIVDDPSSMESMEQLLLCVLGCGLEWKSGWDFREDMKFWLHVPIFDHAGGSVFFYFLVNISLWPQSKANDKKRKFLDYAL